QIRQPRTQRKAYCCPKLRKHPPFPALVWRNSSLTSVPLCLSNRPLAKSRVATQLAVPVSFRFRVAFLPAQLPFRFHGTATLWQLQLPETHAHPSRHRRSATSSRKPCIRAPAHRAVDCCEIFNHTPFATSIPSKLYTPSL